MTEKVPEHMGPAVDAFSVETGALFTKMREDGLTTEQIHAITELAKATICLPQIEQMLMEAMPQLGAARSMAGLQMLEQIHQGLYTATCIHMKDDKRMEEDVVAEAERISDYINEMIVGFTAATDRAKATVRKAQQGSGIIMPTPGATQ